ncbi:MAG: hypothetical protein RLZZ292_250 [Bacteroidota bacterium]|jgi:hypothetical protein
MKIKLSIFLSTPSLFFLLCILSCTKDTVKKPEESPFFSFFDQPAIKIDTTATAATTWDYGFAFNPLVNGTITQLGVKLPKTGDFVIKLWNLDANKILTEKTVTATIVGAATFVAITPIAVKKDANLGLTITANTFYRIQKVNASSFTFPLTIGNLRINSFNEDKNANTTGDFPSAKNASRVAPCVNVIFVED